MTDQCRFAVYGGDQEEFQGLSGRIVKRDSNGIWITLKDTFLNDEPVDTEWAYEMIETILPHFFGHPYTAERVTVFARPDECLEFND